MSGVLRRRLRVGRIGLWQKPTRVRVMELGSIISRDDIYLLRKFTSPSLENGMLTESCSHKRFFKFFVCKLA